MKKLLLWLDPLSKKNSEASSDIEAEDNYILKKIEANPMMKKYGFLLGASLVMFVLTFFFLYGSVAKNSNVPPPPSFSLNFAKNQKQQLLTMPFPHQSFNSISDWLSEAVEKSFSFDFANYDKKVAEAAYYFTKEGYEAYLSALDRSKIRQAVLGENLEVSTIAMGKPIWVNGGCISGRNRNGSCNGGEFWRYRFDVLTSYYGGKDIATKSNLVEVLVFRVPSYINPKGLAINQFNMKSN